MEDIFYASVLGIFLNPRDCRIEFKDSMPGFDENGNLINQISPSHTVIMSLVTAKELATILNEQISSYEKQFGPIVSMAAPVNKDDNKE